MMAAHIAAFPPPAMSTSTSGAFPEPPSVDDEAITLSVSRRIGFGQLPKSCHDHETSPPMPSLHHYHETTRECPNPSFRRKACPVLDTGPESRGGGGGGAAPLHDRKLTRTGLACHEVEAAFRPYSPKLCTGLMAQRERGAATIAAVAAREQPRRMKARGSEDPMALEIERKFLVTGDEWRNAEGVVLRQGYLSTHPERTVRVRIEGDKAKTHHQRHHPRRHPRGVRIRYPARGRRRTAAAVRAAPHREGAPPPGA